MNIHLSSLTEEIKNLSTRGMTMILLFLFPLVMTSTNVYINLQVKSFLLCSIALMIFIMEIIDILKKRENIKFPLINKLSVFYILTIIISTILSINFSNSLFGAVDYRVGSITLIAFIICGAYVKSISSKFMTITSFISAICLTLFSIFINFPFLLESFRLIGPVFQSNVLAVVLSIGFILGLSLYNRTFKYENALIALGHLVLLVGIILTQSRSILFLCMSFGIIIAILFFSKIKRHIITLCILILVIAFSAIAFSAFHSKIDFSHIRIFNPVSLQKAAIYRIHLQEQGLKLLTVTPFYGWGNDSIMFVFNKYFELPEDLESSYINDHIHIESTHNIYLDKFLTLGWFGGISYLLIIIITLYKGIKYSQSKADKLILFAFIFLCLQGFVNVTMMEQEVINWIFIFKINNLKRV